MAGTIHKACVNDFFSKQRYGSTNDYWESTNKYLCAKDQVLEKVETKDR